MSRKAKKSGRPKVDPDKQAVVQSISFPPELYRRIRADAAANGKTISKIVVERFA